MEEILSFGVNPGYSKEKILLVLSIFNSIPDELRSNNKNKKVSMI